MESGIDKTGLENQRLAQALSQTGLRQTIKFLQRSEIFAEEWRIFAQEFPSWRVK
jgi:hypothetical protein